MDAIVMAESLIDHALSQTCKVSQKIIADSCVFCSLSEHSIIGKLPVNKPNCRYWVLKAY